MVNIREFLLTFDTEDFITPKAVSVLEKLLEKLDKNNFKALFFISGHMAERLSQQPQIIDLLNEHEIGYHSSSHSVHPTIFEFTDVENYETAYQESIKRETSHIDPLTGKIGAQGGIVFLKSLFPSKQISAFRAPGCCWSPPHLEALRDLGIKFDFSTSMYSKTFSYKDITFYPYSTLGDWQNKQSYYRLFLLSIIKRKITIAGLHPSFFLNLDDWDSIYWNGNPSKLVVTQLREDAETSMLLKTFDLFLKRVKYLEKIGLIQTNPNLKESSKQISITAEDVTRCYEHSIRWPKRLFKYEPKYLRNHFFKFFNVPLSNKTI